MIPQFSDYEANALLATLKQLLRERKIGYQAIAESLEVSLPTVKRMLNKPNLPLDRLYAICRIAQLDPVDVFSRAAKGRPQHTVMTEEQDTLFFERPEFLSYFMKLAEGLSPDEIADAESLPARSTQRYLAGLEKVGLIERDTGTKIRLLVAPPFGFGPDSRVLRAQHAEFLQHVVSQVLSPEREEGTYAILKPFMLQQDLYSEMLDELAAVVDKYAYHSEHPGNRDVPNRKPWHLALAAGPADTEEPEPLKAI